jgi:regulator of protease activity HflC (stomatin/prohibitin superfamily)
MKYRKIFDVKPNTIGFLYKKNQFQQKLEPGIYRYFDFKKELMLITVPTTSSFISLIGQEALTKDNIALRFSAGLVYRIDNPELFLTKFPLDRPISYIISDAVSHLYHLVQVAVRKKIGQIDSESMMESRDSLSEITNNELTESVAKLGIVIEQAQIKDINFPKNIQDLFAKHLEAKIKAKADLENARTTVAAARALKNAAELVKNDPSIQFMQYLETIREIAAKGKHTFLIGDIQGIKPIV